MPNQPHLRYEIAPGLAEDQVWRNDILPALEPIPKNVRDIWGYCFSEMFNNAIDHSGGSSIRVKIDKTPTAAQILVLDNGIGIFRKIQEAFNLLDERHAILELSKGKLTTSPEKHTGEGIFFTSRLLDSFNILSGSAAFARDPVVDEDWLFELEQPQSGTAVFMKLDNHASRTCEEIFCLYSSEDRCDFTKTVVPVRLALYGHEKLISRSQAKRVVARVDLFQSVVFDFEGLDVIGRSFADQIFRVFANSHPQILLRAANMNTEIRQIIEGTGFVVSDDED